MKRLLPLSIVFALTALIAPIQAIGAAENATTRAKVRAAGVSLEYPSSWVVFTSSKADLARQRKALAKIAPKAAKAWDSEAQDSTLSNTKFRAGDFEAKLAGHLGGNVGVIVSQQELPSTLEEVTSAFRAAFDRQGVQLLGVSETTIDGVTAFRIDTQLPPSRLPDGTTATVLSSQLLIPGSRGLAAVTVASDSLAVNDPIIASVRPI